MTRPLPILALATLTACEGTAWNTTVAANMAVRSQMAASVVPGQTTETELITRWGRPVQKVREGGQVEYVYREILRPWTWRSGYFRGDSENYVIVTFQYGIATGVRTSESEICRATFPPRPPGPGFANPTEVHPVDSCPGLYRPPVGIPAAMPLAGAQAAPEPLAAPGMDGTITGGGAGETTGEDAPAKGTGGNGSTDGTVRGEDGIAYGEPIYPGDYPYVNGRDPK